MDRLEVKLGRWLMAQAGERLFAGDVEGLPEISEAQREKLHALEVKMGLKPYRWGKPVRVVPGFSK